MINRPATRPDFRQPIGPIYGMPSNPLFAAIMQSVVQQQQQEQQKAQIMQALGFGGNMSPFGAIPQGHGIINMDGKVWTRPGGTPPGIQGLLENLLGLQQGGTRGMQQPNTGTFQYGRPGGVPEAQGNDKLGYVANEYQTAASNGDMQLIEFLRRNYPEIFEEKLGQVQNSGQGSMAPALYPRTRLGGF